MAAAYYWQFSPTQFFLYTSARKFTGTGKKNKKKNSTLWALKLKVRDAVEKKKKKEEIAAGLGGTSGSAAQTVAAQ